VESDQIKQPAISHTMPTMPGEPVTIILGPGASGEELMRYLLNNRLATVVEGPAKRPVK